MINNINKISQKISFSNKYCYNIELIIRRKDINVDLDEDILITNEPIKNRKRLLEVFDKYKNIADKLNARIYFIQNPIYYQNFAHVLKQRANNPEITDIMLYDLYGNKNCEMIQKNKYNLIDIDQYELNKINDIISYIDTNCSDTYYVPTVDGYHIVGDSNEIYNIAKLFSNEQYNLYKKLHLDCRVLLYTPLDRKVTE